MVSCRSMKAASLVAVGALGVAALLVGPRAGSDEGLGLGIGAEARATVSVLMTLDEMVEVSSLVVVAQPTERFSRWEELGGSKRIVTFTRLAVQESVTGDTSDDVWVRTLGGKVDKIGQAVAGEAELKLGETALVFLARAGDQLVVTGMAQGHFPLEIQDQDLVLRSSPDTGTLLKRKDGKASAREELLGLKLSAAKKLVKARRAAK